MGEQEGYKPSDEEIQEAEVTMTDEQKAATKERLLQIIEKTKEMMLPPDVWAKKTKELSDNLATLDRISGVPHPPSRAPLLVCIETNRKAEEAWNQFLEELEKEAQQY